MAVRALALAALAVGAVDALDNGAAINHQTLDRTLAGIPLLPLLPCRLALAHAAALRHRPGLGPLLLLLLRRAWH